MSFNQNNSDSAKKAERDYAVTSMREALQPGAVIYTVLRSVSASGMSRTIDLYYVKDGQVIRITWSAAKILESTYDRRKEALRVCGCGTDTGFDTVYNLSYCLFGDGYALNHQWL
jgi:hypothetical protein